MFTKKLLIYCLLGSFCFYSNYATAEEMEIPAITAYADSSNPSGIPTPSNIVVINRQQIVASQATSLSEVLQAAGASQLLNTSSGDSSQTMISIRGFGDNAAANTLILVDGIPQRTQTLNVAPNLNAFALAAIERVEIIPGSQGTLYGDQAVGGVVNIITRKPEQLTIDTDIGAGSYNERLYSLFVGDKLQNGFSYQVIGLSDHTDNYRQHNTQGNDYLKTGLSYAYDQGQVFFNYQLDSLSVLYPGSLTLSQAQADPQQASIFTNYSNGIDRQYQGGITHHINNNWTANLIWAQDDIVRNGFMYSQFTNQQHLLNVEAKLTGNVNQHFLTLGTTYSDNDFNLTNAKVTEQATAQQRTVYAHDVITLIPHLELTLGARETQQNNDSETGIGPAELSHNSAFVTEQGLSYEFSKAWRWYLRRDGNFSFPKADENTNLPNGIDALKAQLGVSYETGIEWHQFKRSVKFMLYQLRLRNEIAFNPTQTPTQPFGAYNNLDPTLRNGSSLIVSTPLINQLTLTSHVDYVDPRFASGQWHGNMIPGVSPLTAGISMNYQPFNHWQIYDEALYAGSHYSSDDVANNGGKIHGYWIDNLGMSYKIKAIELALRINNIFNQHYDIYTVYTPATTTTSYYPAAGRNFLLTVKYSLA